MKIALVHDYIKEYGGAERVLEALHEIYPEASIYTLIYLPEFLGPHRQRVEKWDIRPVIPSWTPFLSKLTSPLRLLAPILFGRLDLSAYDLVIVSATGAYNPNLISNTQQVTSNRRFIHVCYCHTPPRYLYGLPTAREWTKHWWIRVPAQIANHFLRLVDFKSAQKVDYFIANSKNTASRIWKFYRQKAKVIYPPVDVFRKTQRIRKSENSENQKVRLSDTSDSLILRSTEFSEYSEPYFLTGGRLARSKRIDLAVEACAKLNLPLKVFGRMFAGYGEELKKMAACPPKSGEAGRRWSPTVEFLGEVTDEEKAKLFAGCKAFIFPGEEEDFGITPVEAMSFGKPVIALRSGGVLESVIEGKTGVFFDQPTTESLVNVLKKFDSSMYQTSDCQEQVQKFSKERFIKEIKEFIYKRKKII